MKNNLKILAISLISIFSLSFFASAQTPASGTLNASALDDTSSSTSDSSSSVKPTPDYQKVLYVTIKENTEWDGAAPISNVADFDNGPIQFDLKPSHASTFFRPGETVNGIVYAPEKNFVGTDEIDWSFLADDNKISGKIYINVKSSITSSTSKSSVSQKSPDTLSSSANSSIQTSSSSALTSAAANSSASSAVSLTSSNSSSAVSTTGNEGNKVGILIIVIFAVLAAATAVVTAIKIRKKK